MPRKTNKKKVSMKGGSNGQEQLLPGLSIRNYYPLNQYNEDPSRMIASDRLTPVIKGGKKKSKSRKNSSKKRKTLKNKRVSGGNYLKIVNPNLTADEVKSVAAPLAPTMV
jgi:hypothetical protein